MESNGDYDELVQELKALNDSKRDIEARIPLIQAKLRNQKGSFSNEHELSADSIYRYSRQLLLPSFGVQVSSSSAALLLSMSKLSSHSLHLEYFENYDVSGKLGMVDHDVVELNNLHRQIIHGEAYIGRSKVESAAAACRSINSTIEVVEHREALRTSNALEIVSKYDIVIDATDNAPSRYLISDCCVLLGKVSLYDLALHGLEGQLVVYNYKGGPCYRCLFPTPPPTTACQRCSDSGVLGVVPGVIGCLQALEAIKVASLVGEPLSERMLLFYALSARIRIVQEHRKVITSVKHAPLKLKLLTPDSRISSKDYSEVVKKGEPHVLIDVRPSHHYKIVSLPKSMNVPLASLEGRLPEISSALNSTKESVHDGSDARLCVVCRRGNDSQRAVDLLHKAGFTSAKDIVGGLESWAHDVDQRFPTY
ncbi:adenylyltransferase and sulfurtransferase [Tanacetum coccineum]